MRDDHAGVVDEVSGAAALDRQLRDELRDVLEIDHRLDPAAITETAFVHDAGDKRLERVAEVDGAETNLIRARALAFGQRRGRAVPDAILLGPRDVQRFAAVRIVSIDLDNRRNALE